MVFAFLGELVDSFRLFFFSSAVSAGSTDVMKSGVILISALYFRCLLFYRHPVEPPGAGLHYSNNHRLGFAFSLSLFRLENLYYLV